MNQLYEAAKYYASLGWKIFPLAPGQKTPITAHGCKDATDDEAQIQQWWNKWPSANIGLACGQESGVYVLDIDVKDHANGFTSLQEFPKLPETIHQDTPNGGAHFLYSAILPPANRNSFRPGIDVRCGGYYIVLPPSTHPNGGTYRWTPGCAPWERSLSEFPDFMRPSTKAPWSVGGTVLPNRRNQRGGDGGNVLRRATSYLSTCDPAIQGQCGHNKLLYAASRLIHGFLLSDSDAFDLLAREYNPRCEPPWDLNNHSDDKDFRRKITEARKLQTTNPEGWLLDDDSYHVTGDCAIDVKHLLSTKSCNTPPVIPGDVFYSDQEYSYLIRPTGLLGEICSWLNATAIKEQPFLALACSLTFLGTIFGRKVRDASGSRTNLYCMGVAPSSAGKAHAMNQIRRLASAAGVTHLIGGAEIASDSAIEDRIHREPATLFLWDEIGHLLAHIKSGVSQHHAQIVSLLMKLYSAAGNIYLGKEYAEQERQRNITQPCCCIYGTSTMERFTGGISPGELQDGWLSRCLVFNSPYDAPKQRGRIEQPVPESLISSVNRWATRVVDAPGEKKLSSFVGNNGQPQPPVQIVVPTTLEADAIFIALDNEAIEYGKKYPALICLWGKAEENARRIALIIACGNDFDNPCIGGDVARYACRLIRYLVLDFSATVAPEIVTGQIDSIKRRLFKIVDKSGVDGILQRGLTKASQDIGKDARNKHIDDLIEAGEVAWAKEVIGKINSKRFWTAENYAKKFAT